MHMKICKNCDKEFSKTYYNHKNPPTFCSRSCVRNFFSKISKGKPKLTLRTGSMRKCLSCDNQFYAAKYLLESGMGKYCSRKCSAKYSIPIAVRASIGTPKPKAKKGAIISCIVCNKKFYVAKNRINRGNCKYCSRSCLAKNHLNKFRPTHGFKSTGKPKHQYKKITVNGKSVRLHRYIMEQHLGRKLEPWEHVHHINDDSSDNRIENLEVLSNADHQRKEYLFRKSLISSET